MLDETAEQTADEAEQMVDGNRGDHLGGVENKHDVGQDAEAHEALEVGTDAGVDVDVVVAALGAVGDAVKVALGEAGGSEDTADVAEQAEGAVGGHVCLTDGVAKGVCVEEDDGVGDVGAGDKSDGVEAGPAVLVVGAVADDAVGRDGAVRVEPDALGGVDVGPRPRPGALERFADAQLGPGVELAARRAGARPRPGAVAHARRARVGKGATRGLLSAMAQGGWLDGAGAGPGLYIAGHEDELPPLLL